MLAICTTRPRPHTISFRSGSFRSGSGEGCEDGRWGEDSTYDGNEIQIVIERNITLIPNLFHNLYASVRLFFSHTVIVSREGGAPLYRKIYNFLALYDSPPPTHVTAGPFEI